MEAVAMPEMEKVENHEERKKVGLIAVVERFAGPDEERPIEFISRRTKRDMAVALADPSVAKVVGLLRGRMVEFKESRKVTF